jgi:DNA polymerase-1
MSAAEILLADLAAAGLTVRAGGGRLWLAPREVALGRRDLLRRVGACKSDLTAHLGGDIPHADVTDSSSGHCDHLVSAAATFRPVTDAAGLDVVLAALGDAEIVALDLETTGLDPRRDRIRLLDLAVPTIDGGAFAYLVDVFAVDPRPLFGVLAEKTILAHNAAYDVGMLTAVGFAPGKVACTMLLSLLLDGPRKPKGYHSLEQMAARELGLTLDKSHQADDWSVPELTAEQLAYAALDAAVLLPLHAKLMGKVKAAGMTQAADVEMRCLPAVVWLANSGVPFDRPAWDGLAAEAGREADVLLGRLNEAAPPRPETVPGVKAKLKPGPWNWGSGPQVAAVFQTLGVRLPLTAKGNPSTTDEVLAGLDHPLAALLREYRSASKRTSTYGEEWLQGAYHEGRLYAEWRQMGCITGRMANAGPNLQNLPGDPRYRACFRAPEGRVLVKGDYSQIELRIAAKIAGDRRMLDAYANGEDLHSLTARQMTGKEEVTSQERKRAKPVNFGRIYGQGVERLRRTAKADYGLDLTEGEAAGYRRAFFDLYRGIRQWHDGIRRARATETRTLAGRRVLVEADGFYGAKANYMVQGTGGDGLKLALALLYERRDQCPGAFPVLAIHDEIVVEADVGQEGKASAWLKGAMIDGMAPLIDPVPCEVDVTVGRTWGGD